MRNLGLRAYKGNRRVVYGFVRIPLLETWRFLID